MTPGGSIKYCIDTFPSCAQVFLTYAQTSSRFEHKDELLVL